MAGSKKSRLKTTVTSATPAAPIADSADDEDLMNELMAQLDSKDQTVQTESATILNQMNLGKQADTIESAKRKDAKGRFLARQARKAAALAKSYAPDNKEEEARLEREAKEEEKSINKICGELNLQLYEINPDGHCLFSAVADQLVLLDLLSSSQANYLHIRRKAAEYMLSHSDEFLPFLPSPGGEDRLMTPEEYTNYCHSIRDTAVWGGEPEILALSRAFNVPIHVIQGSQPPVVVHEPPGILPDSAKRAVRISYHRRMYGLGEHYNSLRPKSGFPKISSTLQAIFP